MATTVRLLASGAIIPTILTLAPLTAITVLAGLPTVSSSEPGHGTAGATVAGVIVAGVIAAGVATAVEDTAASVIAGEWLMVAEAVSVVEMQDGLPIWATVSAVEP